MKVAWMIEVEGLTKTFGNHHALSGIDLKVGLGEFLVVLGPNGAGKTTLIKVLATIMKPSSGRAFLAGMELKENAGKIQRLIGVVTHRTFLYSDLTGYENLNFYCQMYDVPNAKQRIHEVSKMVGMTPRLHDRVGTLSRGMQQRLSLARCLLHSPPILLLDEPDTGLDQQSMAMVWEVLKMERGVQHTVILTTHNLEQGLELGERIVILNEGKLVYEGTRQALDPARLKQVYQQNVGVR